MSFTKRALRSAIDSAIETARQYRDAAPLDPAADAETREARTIAQQAWERDVQTLTAARGLIVAAPDLLTAGEGVLMAFRLGNPEALKRAIARLESAVSQAHSSGGTR